MTRSSKDSSRSRSADCREGTALNYVAIIGDIKGSRSITQRETVQNALQATLDAVDENFPEAIASRFLITLGDEFQGLLRSARQAVTIVRFIADSVPQLPLRFGMGIGALTTPLRDYALGMDGPAFHRARDAISLARAQEMAIVFDTGCHTTDRLLTVLSRAVQEIESGWTEKRRRVVREYRRLQNQREVADLLGIDQSTVSIHLSRARFDLIREAEEAIAEALEELCRGGAGQ